MSKSGGYKPQADSLTAAERLLIQALILNDVTPFPGGNVDAAITSRASALDMARLLNAQYTRPYVIEEVEFDDIALIGPTSTSDLSIIPVFPVGCTKVKAYVVATLMISNQTANAQNFTPVLEAQVSAGGYNSVWAPGDIVTSVPATIGTATQIVAECDISAYFIDGQQTDIHFAITQTSANSVHYTSQATIFLVYTL